MADPSELRDFVKATVRAEKARSSLTFGQLSAALRAVGVTQSATNLSTKFARGGMSAQLFVAIMKVLGRQRIDLAELELPPVAGKPARRPAARPRAARRHRADA